MEDLSDKIRAELEHVRRNCGGVLRPDAVVEFARDPESALHSKFTWDDTEAARQHRLWQARQVIRVAVEILPRTNTETRVYVSLVSDRIKGGGYRPLKDVMSDAEMRAEMIRQALGDFKRVRDRYQQIRELAPIFEAIESVESEQAIEVEEKAVA